MHVPKVYAEFPRNGFRGSAGVVPYDFHANCSFRQRSDDMIESETTLAATDLPSPAVPRNTVLDGIAPGEPIGRNDA